MAWWRCRARRGELGEVGEVVELGGALRPLFIGGQGGGDESGAVAGGASSEGGVNGVGRRGSHR